ncbi:MAG: hypothetical protein ABRQ27_06750 [Clostridiaceae bacterium]
MKLKLWQKNILSMIVIVVAGYILFITAFILAALVSRVYGMIVSPFAGNAGGNAYLIHFSWHYVYLIFNLLLAWLVLRSRFNDLVKAAFLTMPLMVVLMEVGIQFYQQPQPLVLGIGAVIIGVILFYLYKKKLPWMYYFSTVYVTVMALIVLLSGMEI